LGVLYSLIPRLLRGFASLPRWAFFLSPLFLGALSAGGGGRRYDQLVEELGGTATPAVGWAMGLERLVVLLQKQGEPPAPELDIYVVSQGTGTATLSLQISQMLRGHGLRVEMDVSQSSLGKQIKRADKLGSKACVIVGETEVTTGEIPVKWLATGVQEIVTFPNGFRDGSFWQEKLR